MTSQATHRYEAIVVGAGYIGCAIAAELARAGLRTALLERGSVAAGASGANYGNIQIQDAELTHSLPMITRGQSYFEALEARLGQSLQYRPLGSLLLIETEAQWQTMAARLPALQAAGIPAELVPAQRLPELEPLLNPHSVLGACYHPHEGQLYPFALLWAYLRLGFRHGLALHPQTEVTGFTVRSGKMRGVATTQGQFETERVVLATGAWTPRLGRMLGREWAIQHVHGQALVTESTPQRLHNHHASAAFFETLHEETDSSNDSAAVLALAQSGSGHFLLGEAAVVTTELGDQATPAGQAAIAAEVGRFFPALGRLRTLRGWAAPVAFTADGLPFLGPVAGLDGLILATAFKSTVIVTPLIGENVAQLVVDGRSKLDMGPFSPNREVGYAG